MIQLRSQCLKEGGGRPTGGMGEEGGRGLDLCCQGQQLWFWSCKPEASPPLLYYSSKQVLVLVLQSLKADLGQRKGHACPSRCCCTPWQGLQTCGPSSTHEARPHTTAPAHSSWAHQSAALCAAMTCNTSAHFSSQQSCRSCCGLGLHMTTVTHSDSQR